MSFSFITTILIDKVNKSLISKRENETRKINKLKK